MKHAASESDVTSQGTTAASSPPRTPKRPAYYVQSPSRDSSASHGAGDDKSSASARTTPVYNNSPLESPSHPSSSAATAGRHSRVSSATRFSATLLRSSSPVPGGGRRRLGVGLGLLGSGAKLQQQGWWREVGAIDEEDGEVDGEREGRPQQLPRCCVVAFWLSALALALAVVCLVVWGAARRYQPSVAVKSLTVHNLYASEGTDRTGVPTKLLTLNCSLEIHVRNPSTTFGIHVASTSLRLTYSEIAVANGQLGRFYQPRASRRVRSVVLHGERTPLYGAGAALALGDGVKVPLTLEMAVRTRAYVMGSLVRVTHAQRVRCCVAVDPGSSKAVRFSRNACSSYR